MKEKLKPKKPNFILLAKQNSFWILTCMLILLCQANLFGQHLELELVDITSQKPINKEALLLKSAEETQTHINKLLDSLHQIGYIQAHEVKRISDKDTKLTSNIYIGTKIKFAKITLADSTNIILDFSELNDMLNKKDENSKNLIGYKQLDNIEIQSDTLFASMKLAYEKERRIDHIEVKIYEEFPKKLLRHKYGLKEKQILDLKKLDKIQAEINKENIISVVKPAEILFEKEKTSLYFYLEKRKTNYFDGALGFSTDDKNKLQFQGNIDISLFNNLNKGEKFQLKYIANSESQKEIQASLEIPLIAKSPISPSLELGIFKRDSTYTNTSIKYKLNYEIPKFKFFLGHETNNSSVTKQQLDNITSYDSKFTLLGLEHQEFNESELQPIKSSSYIEYGFGNKKTEEKINQHKIQGQLIRNINLKERHQIYLSGQYKRLFSKDYLENELFRIGGMESLRGVEENSIISSEFIGAQAEYRFNLNNTSYIHSITDYGLLQDEHNNKKINIWSLGVGIGMINKFGLFKLSIANPIQNGSKNKFENTRIHIQLKTKF